ncbi:MAG: anti-sigma factor family protein [Candidatus Acidiferrum sp.]
MNTWTCEQTEARLSEYLDGFLDAAERAAFDAHVPACERCGPLLGSVSHLVLNLHSMEEVEPPPHLVYAILDKTLGPRDALTGWRAAFGWLRGFATPRFAYGAASLAATFLVIATASGFNWRNPRLADLRPTTVYRNANRQAHFVYARSTKFVSDLRVVYEIQALKHEDSQMPTSNEETLPQSSPGKQPGQTDSTKPASPNQQNRADDVTRHDEILAACLPMENSLAIVRSAP